MQMMKWSVIALAVAAGTSQMALASNQSESKGFVEDSSFDLFSRALYMNRDYKNGAGNIEDANKASGFKSGYREETGLGIRGLFESGFTEGTVGFGIDAHTLSSIKLDSGQGRTGTGQFALNDQGEPEDTQTEAGAAVKARLSNTVLKHGNQFTASPVFATDDSRILPEVATGTYLTSTEIEGLELSAGRFTALSSQTATGRDSNTMSSDQDGDGETENYTLKSANIFGASYSFTENFSGAFHASDVEDFWTKKYVNLNYTVALADDQSLGFDFNYYKSDDQGQKLAGDLQNKLWSIAPSYTLGAHTLTLAYQRSSGDTGYNYGIDGNGTIFVANSVQISDFMAKDERSYQARYDLDMTSYGVPGLSFMTRYVTGDNISVDGFEQEGKEHEFNFETKYVVQEGAAKDLSLRLRNSIYRSNEAASEVSYTDLNDLRLIAEYPLDIL
ncbi:MAG: outer membrane porin, OprD family [Pseudomonas sp. PGPPP3]|nr:MAG: outer membrane porin, OprD family [Pseudomonas sp. PGPPP3]